jgi:hypothetical protein
MSPPRTRLGFRCSNPSCGCDVESASGVCGILCHERAPSTAENEQPCGCGHADCYQDADWRLALEFED